VLCPGHDRILGNLGAVYWNVKDIDQSLEYSLAAVAANNNNMAAHCNLGLLYNSMNKFDEAEQEYRLAQKLNPDKADYAWNLMMNHLDRGDWKRGLEEFDVRFRYASHDYEGFNFPRWHGEDLTDKTLLIRAEQGVGDCIMVSRFLPLIKEKWPSSKILFLTQHWNLPLFWEYKRRGVIDEFVPFGVLYPEADYGIYMMSLLGIFNTTPDNIPPDPGFLKDYAKHVRSFKLKTTRSTPKVGICWAGNPDFLMNHWRSFPLETMAPILTDPDITFFSLQMDEAQKDIERLGMTPILFDLAPRIKKEGWNATISAVQQLDLVITVDTAPLHLAGALDIPVWGLLNHANYWPYGRDGKLTTPWYPSLKLVRQDYPGQWETAINRVVSDLKEFKTKFKPEVYVPHGSSKSHSHLNLDSKDFIYSPC
jgi:tetratricopeptide (TPR) repeat protein